MIRLAVRILHFPHSIRDILPPLSIVDIPVFVPKQTTAFSVIVLYLTFVIGAVWIYVPSRPVANALLEGSLVERSRVEVKLASTMRDAFE